MTFSLKKNRRNTRSYGGSAKAAPSRSTTSRPNTRNRARPVKEKRPFALWSKLRGGRVQRFFCVLLLLAGLVAAVTGVCAGSLWLYGKATTSDFFATRHIDVAGNVRLSREMVLQYGGLKEGENSLAVSIAEVERKLRATPWVEEVSVKRLLPDRFVIKIKERMPTFWVHKDGVLYYANESGEAIAPVESRNFLSLPTLTGGGGGHRFGHGEPRTGYRDISGRPRDAAFHRNGRLDRQSCPDRSDAGRSGTQARAEERA